MTFWAGNSPDLFEFMSSTVDAPAATLKPVPPPSQMLVPAVEGGDAGAVRFDSQRLLFLVIT